MGIRALDPTTLLVELEGPTAYFPQLVASWATYPVPRHVVEAHDAAWTSTEHIVTNGPFRLEAWRQGESIVLVRNLRYHGRFTGNVNRVELRMVPTVASTASEGVDMYEADRLDLSPVDWDTDWARQRHADELVSGPRLIALYVGFDASRPPFDDFRVRRAFALATDRRTLGDVVLQGYHFPATGGFVPPGMAGHSPEIALPYDPDWARKLLTKAGYPGGRGFPIVEALASRSNVPLNEYLQAQWRENLAIKIEWQSKKLGVFLDRLNRDPPHIFRTAWVADYADPVCFLRASSVQQFTRWRNPAYEKLVTRARQVMDQCKRMHLYQQADRILVQDAAVLPLTYFRLNLLIKPWVRTYPISPIDRRYYKDVIIAPH